MKDLSEEEAELIARVRAENRTAMATAKPAAVPLLSWERFKKAKRPKDEKRSLRPLAIGLLVIGAVVTTLFIIFMQSTADQIGSVDYFNGLTQQLAGSKEYKELMASSGLSWYSDFYKFYGLRWVIAGAIMTLFLVLSALTFIIDIARRGIK